MGKKQLQFYHYWMGEGNKGGKREKEGGEGEGRVLVYCQFVKVKKSGGKKRGGGRHVGGTLRGRASVRQKRKSGKDKILLHYPPQ